MSFALYLLLCFVVGLAITGTVFVVVLLFLKYHEDAFFWFVIILLFVFGAVLFCMLGDVTIRLLK